MHNKKPARLRAFLAVSAALLRRLKELDGISRRIVEDDLGAAWAGCDVISKMNARGFQAFDLSPEIFDINDHSVPAGACLRFASVTHRFRSASRAERRT